MKGTAFKDLVGGLRHLLAELPDRRKGKNLSYAMEDFGLSAFRVFFTQCPSFLAHQKAMQQAKALRVFTEAKSDHCLLKPQNSDALVMMRPQTETNTKQFAEAQIERRQLEIE